MNAEPDLSTQPLNAWTDRRAFRARGAALLVLLLASPARGDGAFPSAMALLLPADRPGEIDLATTFGLVVSRDGGASWRVVCEAAVDPEQVSLYQLGPPPDDALLAVGRRSLHRSTDACAWTAVPLPGGALPSDVFASPTDGSRVLAIGAPTGDGGAPASTLYASLDGGRSFTALPPPAPPGATLASVEIPRTQPGWVYATASTAAQHPLLLSSRDGGAHFDATDLFAALGPATTAIAAVDPDDAGRLYLRVLGASADSLAIVDGGGAEVRVALLLAARMTAFLRRADGTLLCAAADGHSYRSADGGQGFVDWPVGVPLRALGERGGRLYAAASGVAAPFAVAVSDDGGAHFQKLLALPELCGPLECPAVLATCGGPWAFLAAQLGVTGSAGCGRATADAASVAGDPGPGCGCTLGAARGHDSDADGRCLVLGAAALGLGLSLSASVRRRRASQFPP